MNPPNPPTTPSASLQPSPAVLAAFGLDAGAAAYPEPLTGGQGTSYRAGNLVLKPAGMPEEVAWLGEVLNRLPERGFRVARPVQATDGRWVVDGWAATRWVAGAHAKGRWAEIFATGEAFHAALEPIPRPAFLDRRNDWWSVGDQVAWDELPWTPPPALAPVAEPLLAARRPLKGLASQVIHGDLGGNMLFLDGLSPAIIDVATYFRPVGFAAAIVAVDALAWEGADQAILGRLDHLPHLGQLLLRAALYRIVTTAVAHGDNPARLAAEVRANRDLVRLIVDRCAPEEQT